MTKAAHKSSAFPVAVRSLIVRSNSVPENGSPWCVPFAFQLESNAFFISGQFFQISARGMPICVVLWSSATKPWFNQEELKSLYANIP